MTVVYTIDKLLKLWDSSLILADLGEIYVWFFHESWKSHLEILAKNQSWTGRPAILESPFLCIRNFVFYLQTSSSPESPWCESYTSREVCWDFQLVWSWSGGSSQNIWTTKGGSVFFAHFRGFESPCTFLPFWWRETTFVSSVWKGCTSEGNNLLP